MACVPMKTVLVVDDSPIDRKIASRILENAGWNVLHADGGREALAQIQEQAPCVVVTDLMMPEMDGVELIKAVRRMAPEVPIIAMTSMGSEETATRALESGAA